MATQIYVLKTVVRHDGTYIEGVALTREAAESWAEDGVRTDDIWRGFEPYFPIDAYDDEEG